MEGLSLEVRRFGGLFLRAAFLFLSACFLFGDLFHVFCSACMLIEVTSCLAGLDLMKLFVGYRVKVDQLDSVLQIKVDAIARIYSAVWQVVAPLGN